ncbi:MAG: type I-C CRISPR-associated endonuclease Cas1c [Tissierellia bacterium]|nr:type I-C CRISPR-associated endonuclease Cas1c [Tissierellia bacterium]
MRKLRNTLYVTKDICYLAREGTNIVIREENKTIGRYPIHILENIVCFNYNGVSPAIIELCNSNNVSIAFVSPSGFYQGRFVGITNGNVLLRRQQYRIADSELLSLGYVKNILCAKTSNYRKILRNALRDHESKMECHLIFKAIENLKCDLENINTTNNLDSLRGIEGDSTRTYFSVFDQMILRQKNDFYFTTRSRRPPLDRVNAMLSFGYSILTNEIQSALETVGIDSYVGFFHRDRPGRASMALDLIEELRGYIVDRFVITMINLRSINKTGFEIKENGSVLLNEEGRYAFIKAWQENKQRTIIHPYLEENIEIGLLPYVQAQLLARTIRGDLSQYPPFMM